MKSDTIYLFLRVDGNNFPSGIHQAMYFDYEVKNIAKNEVNEKWNGNNKESAKKLATSFDT